MSILLTDKRVSLILTSLILISILFSIFFIGRTQLLKSFAETNPEIELKSPIQLNNLTGIVPIEAVTKTSTNIKDLNSTLKIDGKDPKAMEIKRINQETILLSTSMDSQNIPPGNHTLSISLYKLTDNEVVLLNQYHTDFNIN